MSEPKHGVAQVVAEAAEGVLMGAPAREISGEAAPGLPFEDLAGPVDAESPVGKLAAARRGPGRPAGAQNRMTKDIRKLILSQYRHPLVALAEIASLDTLALAAHLGCKPVEALDRQIRAAAEVAPYLAAKQAAVDESGQVVLPMLTLNFGNAAPASVGVTGKDGDTLSILDLTRDMTRAMENQGLSEGEAEASHGHASHEVAQAIDAEGESDA